MTTASHQSNSSFCWEKSFFLQEDPCSSSSQDDLLLSQESTGDLSRLLNIIEEAEDAVLSDDLFFGDTDFDAFPTMNMNSKVMVETLDSFIGSVAQDVDNEWPTPAPKRQKIVDDKDLSCFCPNPFTMLSLDYFRGPELKKDITISQLVQKQAEAPKPPTTLSGVDSKMAKATGRQQQDELRFRRYQADQWMDRFEDLIKFKAEHNHCLVPHSFPENQQLAQWVKRQRYQYKLKSMGRHSTLTFERQQELEDMGFVWDSHKAAWDERLEALKEYHAKYGNTLVPTNYEVDKPLAVWVKCQRRQLKLFRQGRKSTMTEERFQELEKLGFEWNPRNLS